MPQPELNWYQHVEGGGVHGFDAATLATAQHHYQLRQEAKRLRQPEPVLPVTPLDNIVNLIRGGKMIPCQAPGAVNTLELTAEQIAQLTAADVVESTEAKRERLLAELAALDAQDAVDAESPEIVSPPAGLVGGDTLSQPPRAGRTAAKR